MDVKGKTVLVTGAGSGIGRETVQRFAKEGAHPIATDIDPERAQETVDLLPDQNVNTAAFGLDVREKQEFVDVIESVEDTHGEIDILVNNAGIGRSRRFLETEQDDLIDIIETNILGAWYGCQSVIPGMIESGSGAIVNVASVGGFLGFANQTAYCLTKGAVLNLTRSLACEFGPDGVRVNAVCPGTIWTDRAKQKYHEELPELRDDDIDPEKIVRGTKLQYPLRRFGVPGEVASCIVFLASDDASFVTGHGLVIDGGYSIS